MSIFPARILLATDGSEEAVLAGEGRRRNRGRNHLRMGAVDLEIVGLANE